MTAGLAIWWQGLSRRERAMLALLAALALPILTWLMALRPLAAARAVAEVRLLAAQRDLVAVRAAAPALRTAEDRAIGTAAPALERVREAVAGAGLVADTLGQEEDGRLTLRIAAARGPVLLRLIAGLEAEGLVVQALSASRNEDSSVTASLSLSEPAR